MRLLFPVLLFCGTLCFASNPPPTVVQHVDLQRYMGRWFEIARFPDTPFEKGCVAATADYSLNKDGSVSILNSCRVGSFSGPLRTANGTAIVEDRTTNAKLVVTFEGGGPPGPYWIFELDKAYQYAAVGSPDRHFLWILNRTPQMDQDLYQSVLARLASKGFAISRLERTAQPVMP